jgi:hypothetical protein
MIGATQPYSGYGPGYGYSGYDPGYGYAAPYAGGDQVGYCQQRFRILRPGVRHLSRLPRPAPSVPVSVNHGPAMHGLHQRRHRAL